MSTNRVKTLSLFTTDELKQELNRRKVLDRAQRHLPSAEAALLKAKAKVEQYRYVLKEDAALKGKG